MVSGDSLCVAPPRSSLLDLNHHQSQSQSHSHSHSHGNLGNSSSNNSNGRAHVLLDNNPSLQRKTREITSRYLSPTPARRSSAAYVSSFSSVTHRFPSPPVDRTPYAPNILSSSRRSNSVERRRPSPSSARSSVTDRLSSGTGSDFCVAKRNPSTPRSEQVLWPPSTRATMQAEPYSPPPRHSPAKTRIDSKARTSSYLSSDHTLRPFANVVHRNVSPARPFDYLSKETPERKGSPLRRQGFDQAENSQPFDSTLYTKQQLQHHRWPSSSRLDGAALSRSVDLTGGREKSTSKAASLLLHAKSLTSSSRNLHSTTNYGSFSQFVLSTERSSSPALRTAARRLNLETRLRVKESNARVRQGAHIQPERYIEPVRESDEEEAQLALSNSVPDVCRSRYTDTTASKSMHQSVIKAAPSGGLATPSSSPWSGLPQHTYKPALRPFSPAKLHPSFPARSWPSPTRSRGGGGPALSSPTSNFSRSRSNGAAVMISFGADSRRGKKGFTQAEAAFLHRILHNRLLQWRFLNARAELATNTQRLTGEKLLFSVWARTTELRKSVTSKRIKLQQARQAHKVGSILKAQGPRLQDWSSIQHDHSSALCGAVGALEGAVLRLPVDEGVKGDTQGVREAMASAVDVVHAVESSATSLLAKMGKTNKLVSELAHVAAQERNLIEQCGGLLLLASSFHAEECSLRMQLMQFEQEKVRVLGALD